MLLMLESDEEDKKGAIFNPDSDFQIAPIRKFPFFDIPIISEE